MMYAIYFIVFLLTLIITFTILHMHKKGHKVQYEKGYFRMADIKDNIKNITNKMFNSNNVFSNNNEPIYIKLKKDFPELNIDAMKADIRKYILSVLKEEYIVDVPKTCDFDSNLEILLTDKEIDIKSLKILQTIMDRYYKEDNLMRIKFNTTIEYERRYDNIAPRRIKENYVSEFVHSLADFQKNRTIKCPKCGNDVIVVQKNTRCSNCSVCIDSDIWYFKSIEKR